MRTNLVKANIRAGRPSFGIGTLWPSPELAEYCGHLGFDWYWMDLEHGAFDLPSLANTVRAAEVSGMVPIGRLPKSRDLEFVLRHLETGLMGVIVSHTRSKEDVEFIVRAVKYPPIGERSAGAMRPANWGHTQSSADYYAASNEETLVGVMVEEMEGINHLDEILSVKGLDMVVIGFGDLSMTMGHPGERDHPEVREIRKRAHAKILSSGKALQVTAQNGEAARQAVKEEGALVVRCTGPYLLATACKAWLKAARGG